MAQGSLTEAMREAYATAMTDDVFLETLEIRHPNFAPMYLVRDRIQHEGLIETGETVIYSPSGFRFNLPSSGENGVQELTLAFDNVDTRIMEFLTAVMYTKDPVEIKYRPYLASDMNTPQMNPPLVLFLTDVNITSAEVTGRATFADVLNRAFLSAAYHRFRFPGL